MLLGIQFATLVEIAAADCITAATYVAAAVEDFHGALNFTQIGFIYYSVASFVLLRETTFLHSISAQFTCVF